MIHPHVVRAARVLQRANVEAMRMRRDELAELAALRRVALLEALAKRRQHEPGSHSRANAAHWIREDVRELRHLQGRRVVRALEGSFASL